MCSTYYAGTFCEEESVQLFRVAFFRNDFLQNPYFKKTNEININQQIYFLTLSLNIYEKYTVNQQIIVEKLGFFVNDTYFDVTGIENNSFLRRRQNFHGLRIPAFTGNYCMYYFLDPQ